VLNLPGVQGTLFVRNHAPLGPCSRNMPRTLWWSYGGWADPYERGTPVVNTTVVNLIVSVYCGVLFANNIYCCQDFRIEHGSSQGQNLALTGVFIPSSLDSGYRYFPRVCRLPGKGNSNSHGARPVHQIFSMIKRIRTSRLSIINLRSLVFAGGGLGALPRFSHQGVSVGRYPILSN
jgi:hypothetical protein